MPARGAFAISLATLLLCSGCDPAATGTGDHTGDEAAVNQQIQKAADAEMQRHQQTTSANTKPD